MAETEHSKTNSDLLAVLRTSILDDLFKDYNQVPKSWVRNLLEPLAWFPINRFAKMMLYLDNIVSQDGFRRALQDLVAYFVRDIGVLGSEYIPKNGPLLIVSNHPGTIDCVVIRSKLPRDDLNIIATGFPLLKRLSSTRRYLIFIDPQAPLNISGARSTIQHLQAGGAVLIFPRTVDELREEYESIYQALIVKANQMMADKWSAIYSVSD